MQRSETTNFLGQLPAAVLSFTMVLSIPAEAHVAEDRRQSPPADLAPYSPGKAALAQSRKRGPFAAEVTALAWAPWALIGIGIALAMGCQSTRRRDSPRNHNPN